MSSIELQVYTPQLWWRAPVDRVRQWVPTNPDDTDGRYRPRWPDHDQQRWPLIADAVAAVGAALAARAWHLSDMVSLTNERHYGKITVLLGVELTKTERRILTSWFSASAAVRVDPWWYPITDGRHRLWATLPHLEGHLVPILSDALGYANAASAEVLGSGWSRHFRNLPDELRQLTWFDRSDPVNSEFVAALDSAFHGRFPTPV